MKNLSKFFVTVWIGISISFLTVACNVGVGLGDAVDALPPTMEIQNPPLDATIRDVFAISGTWSDDGQVKSVIVTLERTDGFGTAVELPGTVETAEEEKQGTWSVTVNPFSDAYSIPDGSYQATITALDGGSHTTSITRQFVIDNTPPIIVLQRPSAKSTDSSADSYGQSFTLEGQAADDNNINLINVEIYSDEECTQKVHTVSLNNVPNTINLDVAKFKEDVENDYSAIYGSSKKEGTKPFYCKIIAYDDAQRYPIGENQSAEDTYGNATSTYFLYEEIATSVLSNYKLPEVYKMFSGTYTLTNTSTERSAEEVTADVNAILSTLETKTINKGYFSLNPANNPNFTVSGRENLKKDGTDFTGTSNNLSSGSSLVIEVATGLDSIPLVGDSLKVYLQTCSEYGTANGGKIYIEDVQKTKSGTSYKMVATIVKSQALVIGNNYVIGVEGTDESGNAVIASGKGYGFHFAPSGVSPKFSDVATYINGVKATSENNLYVSQFNSADLSQNTTIRLTGKVSSDDPSISLTIKIDDAILEGVNLTHIEEEIYSFDKTFDTTLISNPSSSAQHEITMIASNSLVSSDPISKVVMYDTEKPSISIDDFETAPKYDSSKEDGTTLAGNYLNGTVSIKIRISDDDNGTGIAVSGDNQSYFEILGSDGNPQSIQIGSEAAPTTKHLIETPTSQSFEIDTTALADNQNITLRIYAWDKAGNKANLDTIFTIDQSTDKPYVGTPDSSTLVFGAFPTKTSLSTVIDGDDLSLKKNIVKQNTEMKLNLYDDDGLGKYIFKVGKWISEATEPVMEIPEGYYDTDSSGTKINDYKTTSGTKDNVTFTPTETGYYKISIVTYDNHGVESDTREFYIIVSGAGPVISFENKPGSLPNGNYELKGSITSTNSLQKETEEGANKDKEYITLTEKWGADKTKTTKVYLDSDRKFTVSLPLDGTAEGNIEYLFEGKNKLLEPLSGTTKFTANRDLTAPEMTVSTPSSSTFGEGAISTESAVFRGTIKEKNPNLIYYQCVKGNGTAPDELTTNDVTTKTEAQIKTKGWNIVDISSLGVDNEGNGTWSFTTSFASTPAERDGKYKLYIQSADLGGNICSMQTVDFAVDSAAPALTINVIPYFDATGDGSAVTATLSGSSTIKVTSGSKYKLKGTVTDASGIKQEHFKINNVVVTPDSNGNWETAYVNTEGTQTYVFDVMDDSGNDSIEGKKTSEEKSVIFDLYDPTASITTIENDNDWIYATGKTYISGTATDASGIGSITVQIDSNSEETVPVSSPWTYSLDCSSFGENTDATNSYHTIKVTVTDKCEKPTTITRKFKLDKSIPVITDVSVKDKDTLNEYTNNVVNVTISGSAYDGLKANNRSLESVVVSAKDKDGNEVDINSDDTGDNPKTITLTPSTNSSKFGYFSEKIATKSITGDGTYTFTVTATDYAGNTTTKETQIVLDTVAPAFGTGTADSSASGYKENNVIPHTETSGISYTVGEDTVTWYNTSDIKIAGTASDTDGTGIATVYYETTKDGGTTWENKNDMAGTTSWSGIVSNVVSQALDSASTIVRVTVKDNANNSNTTTLGPWKIDTTAPELTSSSSTQILSNGTADITFTGITVSDPTSVNECVSGIDAVYVNAYAKASKSSGQATLNGDGTYSYTLDKSAITRSGTVYARIYDKAGNYTDTGLFVINFDNEAPIIKLNTPDDADSSTQAIDVNGTISLSGTTSDNNSFNCITDLEYSTDGTTWTKFTKQVKDDDGTITTPGIVITEAGSNYTISGIDTTALTDNTTYYLRTVGEDTAGNTGYTGQTSDSTIVTVLVNQNSDRPIIKFNEITGATGTMRKYTKTITGSITDDDDVSEFKVFATSSATETPTWTNYNQSNNGTLDWTRGSSSFTYEPNISGDGQIYLYFYVKDSKNGVFETAGTKKPYVYYKGDTGKTDNSNKISYYTDSNPPSFNGKYYFAGTSSEVTAATGAAINNELPGIMTVGGSKKPVIKFRVLPYDASGIKSVAGSLNTSPATTVTFTKESDTAYYVGTLDVSSVTSGSYSFVTTITDNSDLTSTSTLSLNVDNSGPSINVTSPVSTTLVTGDITITGFTSDTYSTVELVKYIVSNNTYYGDPTTYNNAKLYDLVKDNDNEFNAKTNNAFEFPMDGIKYNADGSEYSGNGSNYLQNAALPATVAALTNYSSFTTDSQIYDIPIYIVAADELGNYTVKKDYYVHYNPFSDRPTTEILYPDPNVTENVLSGTIRLSGSAVDNVSVSKVYYQIRPHNKTWAEAKTWVSGTLGATVVDADGLKAIKADANLDADTSFWGIEASGTASWYKSLNDSNSLQIDSTVLNSTAGTYQVVVRAVAVDNNYTLGNWSKPVTITINPKAPSIGSSVPTTIKKYNGNTLLDSKNATGTIYLKGQWYLVTSVEHLNGINEISYQLGDGTSDGSAVYIVQGGEVKDSGKIEEDKSSTAYTSGNKGYTVKIPLDTSTGEGIRTIVISAKDNTESHLSSSASFSFYYDNNAPVISDVKYNSNSFVAGSALTNNNNQLTFGSTVEDNIAGFGKVLFYFYREKTNGNGAERRVYDPFIGNWQGAAASNPARVDVTDSSGNLKSGITKEVLGTGSDTAPIYGVTLSVTKTSTSTLTFTGDNSHIRTGGIAKIADSYRVIKSKNVSGSTVTIEFSPECDTAFTSVFFPYAQVVDNQNGEKTKSFTSTSVTIQGDDGDGMPESVSGLSTSKIWEAGIHGDWIPDGPVTFVMFAFDNSENIAVFTQTGTMANNRPRIAKLYLGTDLNGNGSFVDSEFETYNLLGVEGASQEVFDLTTKDYAKYQNNTTVETTRKSFTVKDKLAVIPEFVGGNGTIYMVFNNNDTTTSPDASGDAVDSHQTGSGTALRSSTTYAGSLGNNIFTISASDVGDDTATDATKQMSFTFWDSTDEATAGSTTQYAFLRVKDVIVDQVDDISPKVRVNPFYWESSSKNSLGGNSTANGHIELEADWTAQDSFGNNITAYDGASSGTYLDSDPKVSGQIVFSGTAYDEHKLSSISFSYGSLSNVTAATYNGTSWTGNSGTDWSCTVYDEKTTSTNMQAAAYFATDTAYFDQNGHKVFWKITIDTAAAITNVADKDQTFTVTASDGTSTWVATEVTDMTGITDSYAIDAAYNKPTYRTDVVPYITKINTTLGKLKSGNPSVYSRTALGHYAVYTHKNSKTYTTTQTTVTYDEDYETVTIEGFNLYNASIKPKYGSTQLSMDTENTSAVSFPVNLLSTSGEVDLTVNDIPTLNNKNNNNAQGSAGQTLSTSNYATYAYNRVPNGDTNNNLTDDVYFSVWQFNSKAALPISGRVQYPQMKINPSSNMLNFAFADGPLYFDMGSSTVSYKYWTASFDMMSGVGLGVDNNGNTYATVTGGDTNSKEADKAVFYTSLWGSNALYSTGDNRHNSTYYGTNGIRYSAIGQKYGDGDTDIDFDRYRIKSPSIATVQNVGSQDIYMAYYDNLNDEVRFKYGKLSPTIGTTYAVTSVSGTTLYTSNNTDNSNKEIYLLDSNKKVIGSATLGTRGGSNNNRTYTMSKVVYYGSATASEVKNYCLATAATYSKSSFGNFYDIESTNAPKDYDTNADYEYVISDSSRAGYLPGAYVSLGVVPGAAKNGDETVVLIWYDAVNNKMLYTYNTTPTTNLAADGYKNTALKYSTNTGWSTPEVIFTSAGSYCNLAVDANGGIHMAAFDSATGDLKYAYKSSYSGSTSTCTVDSSGIVGTDITIDVALNSSGQAIPYIGYYALSASRPKYAYLVSDYAGTAPDGIDSNESFTGKWEVTYLPLSNITTQGTVNIGVWKDSDGKLKNSTTGNSYVIKTGSSYSATNAGNAYGNGTPNAILAYEHTVTGSTSTIETAQLK